MVHVALSRLPLRYGRDLEVWIECVEMETRVEPGQSVPSDVQLFELATKMLRPRDVLAMARVYPSLEFDDQVLCGSQRSRTLRGSAVYNGAAF